MAANATLDPTKNLGDDSTATFEDDPRFTTPTPGSDGSSENLAVQRDTDDVEDTDDEDNVDEGEDLDDDEEESLSADDTDDDDEEFDDDEEDDLDDDEDDEDVDAEEDDDDLDDEDDDDLDDEDEEDDAEEVAAAPATMRADGLLGYEDEAEDAEKGRSEQEGNATRTREERSLKQPGSLRGTGRATDVEGDDDEGDIAPGVSEDEYTDDDMDTDRVAALPVDHLNWPAAAYNFGQYIGAQPTTFGTLQ